MLICEASLILIIILLGIYVCYTDIKKGVVENKAIAVAGTVSIVLNCIYYALFAGQFLRLYLFNLAVITALAILLYAGHFWAAGDSKLLICMTSLIPGRVYDPDGLRIPGLTYVIIIFLIAYMFIVIESVIAWIKGKKTYYRKHTSIRNIPSIAIDYAAAFFLLSTLSLIWAGVFKDFYRENQLVFSLLNIVLIVFVADSKVMKRKPVLIALAALFILLSIMRGFSGQINLKVLGRNYLIVVLALLLRYFVSGYNYQEIQTYEAAPGMVLAYSTILMFYGSNVKNLPHSTSEDMRDRLTIEQAEAVRRWGNSKKGKESIIIVRKIPFATFIVIGIVIYILIRLVL